MRQSSQESALLKRLDEPVDTGLGLEIDRFLHFLERRSDAALIKIGIDEKQEFLLFPGQHRQTPRNRTKGKPSAYVLVWFAPPVKGGGPCRALEYGIMPVAEKGYAGRSANFRDRPSPLPRLRGGLLSVRHEKGSGHRILRTPRRAHRGHRPPNSTTETPTRCWSPWCCLRRRPTRGVNKATRALFEEVDTPAEMVALGEARLKEHIKTIGLYNMKAKNVIALSQALVEEHRGAVPSDRAALEALPGVGRKTANVVLNTVFGEPTIAVDTHIFRLANRSGLAPGKTPRAVEDGLNKVVPDRFKQHAHHWLILHGRYVCKARTPDCPACVVRDLCRYKGKTA